jgi:hypothetical protein
MLSWWTARAKATWAAVIVLLALLALLELPSALQALPENIRTWARWLRPVSEAGQWAAFVAAFLFLLLTGFAPALVMRVRLLRPFSWELRALSQELFEFLESEGTDYSPQLMSRYDTRFGRRVAEVAEELRDRQLLDSSWENLVQNPTNTLGIRELAQRLSAAAMYC